MNIAYIKLPNNPLKLIDGDSISIDGVTLTWKDEPKSITDIKINKYVELANIEALVEAINLCCKNVKAIEKDKIVKVMYKNEVILKETFTDTESGIF